MNLEPQMVQQLEKFLTQLSQTTYPEPSTDGVGRSMQQVIEHIQARFPGAIKGQVLDVGCGQGQALEIFSGLGLDATGITLNREDLEVCRQRGLDVELMDMSFLAFADENFDFIWCRHCLEHSFMPFFTLHSLHRVLKRQGFAYIEVPAPDTVVGHQTNKNHFSVMGQSMWTELMMRTGFVGETLDLDITTVGGEKDLYWGFILQRTAHG